MTGETSSQDGVWIRHRYGVPAEIGTRVIADGAPGKIVGFVGGLVLVERDTDPSMALPYHPTWHLIYLNRMGRETYRDQCVADCPWPNCTRRRAAS